MKKLSKLVVCLAMMLSGFASTSSSLAATSTTVVPVTATVIASCTVTATALAFGNYNGISGSMLDASATITPTCTSGTSYAVALDAGLGSGATMTTRKLTGYDGGELEYGIFTDISRSTVWGDGTGGTSMLSVTGTGIAQPATMYGRIPAGQTSAVGAYSDTVTVTLTY